MSNPKYGALEVFYSFPSNTTKGIELVTNVNGLKQFHSGPESFLPVTIRVGSVQDGVDPIFAEVKLYIGTDLVDRSDYFTYNGTNQTFAVRIFFFDQFISVSVNDCWVYSYALAQVQYPGTTNAVLKMDGLTTILTDIRRVEIADGREAVFIDYESTTDSAIQSVIQQRPVQIFAHVDRKTTFTYDAEKDLVPAHHVHVYDEETVRPAGLSSDGLVYADEVGVSIDTQVAKEVGLITKLYRLSELTTGYERATGFLQKQARQRRKPRTVIMRLDPRVEVSDVLDLDLIVTSTNRHIVKQIIVEDVGVGIRDGEYTMTVKGREKQ